jgi:hypothetical protein
LLGRVLKKVLEGKGEEAPADIVVDLPSPDDHAEHATDL